MRLLNAIGSILYLLGLAIMFWGLVSLIMGITSTLGTVMSEVRSMASEPAAGAQVCSNPPCNITSDDVVPYDPVDDLMALTGIDTGMEWFFDSMGISSIGKDRTMSPIYFKIKKFFGLLIVGLFIVVLGTLLRLFDSLAKFIDGRGKKMPIEDKYRVHVGKPEKNWVGYVDGRKDA